MEILIKDKFIVFGKPDIGQCEEDAVINVMRSGWLGTGSISQELETVFSDHYSLQSGKDIYSLATGSCSIGLVIALKVCGIGFNDEVIIPDITFAATANAVIQVGATPIIVDVLDNGTINPDEIKKHINKKTKAIIPVHLWGTTCYMEEILKIAKKNNLKVIEDCAHGFGGNVPHGTYGDCGVFSFYPTKNISSGDGGMIISKNKEFIDLARLIASQGLTSGAWKRYSSGPIKNYDVMVPGVKGLISDIHAAIVLSQIRRWGDISKKRNRIWNLYENSFGRKEGNNSHHIYQIEISNRDKIRMDLYLEGIGTGIHYKPLNLEPAYKKFVKGKYPISEYIGETTLSLPISSTMEINDAIRVVESVNKYVRGDK